MSVKVEKLENSKVTMEFKVSKEDFNKALDEAFAKNSKHFKIPGFRAGRVPRNLIEKTYDCRVMDCYGANDAGMNAYEINPHRYHVGYNVLCEIINPIEENTGSLLTTNLLNYTFPLLRYQFGDEVEILPFVDSKEYNGQVLRRILGRTSDVMRLENGHNMTATGFSMIIQEFDIVAFSFNKTGVNEVTLKLQPIKEKYNTQQEDEIRKTIQRYIGDDATLIIEYVEQFEPLKNGKRRYFMNNIDME